MRLDTWHIRADHDNRGLHERWYQPALPGDSGDAWRPITVPSAWNQALGNDEIDVAWYRTTVPAERALDERLWLRFDAACTDLTCWCDGEAIGGHSGNWEPFMFELPPPRPGQAVLDIVVRIDRVRPAPAVKRGERVIEQGHITKGFHDILSRQPAGLWQPVTLHRTGLLAYDVLGLGVLADLATGRVRVELDTVSAKDQCDALLTVRNCGGEAIACEVCPVRAGKGVAELPVDSPRPWSPDDPKLYTLEAELLDAAGNRSDFASTRFGFRQLHTEGRRALLNNEPLFLSGVLDWGHEPMQTSPAPSPAEVRRRFASLRAMGFNCVCICLWYPPQYVYDIADEMGMLIWQEHPVWKPEMTPANRERFKRHYDRFFRLDRNHASVVLVSGSCEHDAFDDDIAAWWWAQAQRRLPDRLKQVQTAFLRLVPPEQTDLYDEHTYENSGRWPEFLADMDDELSGQPPKPFVMGESILYNDWPDVRLLGAIVGDDRPWWVSRVLDDAVAIEADIAQRYGDATLDRFRRQARDWHLAGRKWQTEVFRQSPTHAGLIHNSLRDVAQCPLGLMDDLDQWRFHPAQTRPWLAPNALLLRTPADMRVLAGGGATHIEIGVSRFGATPVGRAATIRITAPGIGWAWSGRVEVPSTAGSVSWQAVNVELPAVASPTRLVIDADASGAEPNQWHLWLVPGNTPPPRRSIAAQQRRANHDEPYAFDEAGYSSGWGLGVRSWVMAEPDPAALLRYATGFDDEPDADAGLVIANTLSDARLEKLAAGGRVLLLPDRSPGALHTAVPTLWGQSPLILDEGPLAGIDSDFLLAALDRDLHHRWVRSVPTGRLGIAGRVTPFIRLLHTLNAIGRVQVMDDLFAARVGDGLLLVSTLDHTTPAGRWLLHRLTDWLACNDASATGELSIDAVRPLTNAQAADTAAATPA